MVRDAGDTAAPPEAAAALGSGEAPADAGAAGVAADGADDVEVSDEGAAGGVPSVARAPTANGWPGSDTVALLRPPRGVGPGGPSGCSPGVSVSRRSTGNGEPSRIEGNRGARQPAYGAPRRLRIAERRCSAVAGANGAGALVDPAAAPASAPGGVAPGGVPAGLPAGARVVGAAPGASPLPSSVERCTEA